MKRTWKWVRGTGYVSGAKIIDYSAIGRAGWLDYSNEQFNVRIPIEMGDGMALYLVDVENVVDRYSGQRPLSATDRQTIMADVDERNREAGLKSEWVLEYNPRNDVD